ncbi:MAG: hypothetical protein ACE5IB_04545 [Candidatus Geothermarchaeales archaeon]
MVFLFGEDEKEKLLRKCTVRQLREITKEKRVAAEPGFFRARPTKEDYIDRLYDEVSVAYLKKLLSGEGSIGRAIVPGGKKIPRSRVIAELRKFNITRPRKSEGGYERDLLNWARGRFGDAVVTPQYAVGRTRIDMVVGGVGIELKVPRTARQLMTLAGQAAVYQKHFGKDLVVILFRPECDPSLVAEFKADMKKMGITVLVKD